MLLVGHLIHSQDREFPTSSWPGSVYNDAWSFSFMQALSSRLALMMALMMVLVMLVKLLGLQLAHSWLSSARDRMLNVTQSERDGAREGGAEGFLLDTFYAVQVCDVVEKSALDILAYVQCLTILIAGTDSL